MSFKERLELEKNNLNKIILFNDGGLFYNLLERSAYAFHTRIKPFKTNVRSLKGYNIPYVSIGVPVSKAEEYLSGLSFYKDEQRNIIVELNEPIGIPAYEAWKSHVLEQNLSSKVREKDMTGKNDGTVTTDLPDNDMTTVICCLKELQSLNIASMTPMETMVFLNDMKLKLKDIKL